MHEAIEICVTFGFFFFTFWD